MNRVLTVLICLIVAAPALVAQEPANDAAEAEMLSRYKVEMDAGNTSAAVKIDLEFTEQTQGENAPETARLTHRYGHALYRDGDYRRATEVLLTALERSNAAFGESGGEAIEINMNIGFAYGQWKTGLLPRTRYFDRALEILRERGERESITYVTTLINIIVNLMGSTSLQGSYTSHLSDTMQSEAVNDYMFTIEREYRNNYGKLYRYMDEAVEIAGRLNAEDEYIASKVSILQAKLKVMDTADLDAVPMGVSGYISGGTADDYYDEETNRLNLAIEDLARDMDANEIYLQAANKVLLEIAWLDKDKDRMLNMCASGTLDSASEYSPDRLYEVMENGRVIAPSMPFSVNRNLFSRRAPRGEIEKDKDGNPVRKPYFMPVCIDGQLMAALVNAPTVTIEELGESRD